MSYGYVTHKIKCHHVLSVYPGAWGLSGTYVLMVLGPHTQLEGLGTAVGLVFGLGTSVGLMLGLGTSVVLVLGLGTSVGLVLGLVTAVGLEVVLVMVFGL